jgi:hypothetical protein
MPAVALAALAALALAACTSAHPRSTPSSSPVATPLFTSDAEALKAATDAYAAYLKVSDEISHDGGANPERIKPYVTNRELEKLVSDFKQLQARDAHTTGPSTFSRLRVASYTGSSLQVYLCSDVSQVRVVNAEGQDVTPSDRSDVLPLSVTFDSSSGHLRLAESIKWSGPSFCE